MIKYYKITATTPLAGCDAYEYVYIDKNNILRFKGALYSVKSLAEYADDFSYNNAEEAFLYSEDWDYEEFMEECSYDIEEISKEEFEMEA